MHRLAFAVAASLLATGSSAAHPIDGIEHLFGATNIRAATGNGRLTLAVSDKGEITVLRWPSPSFWEHLDYTTSTDEEAHEMKHLGARPNQGAFAAVVKGDKVTELRSLPTRVRYFSATGNTIVAEHEWGGGEIEESFVVLPEQDVLVWHVAVEPGQAERAIFYLNPALNMEIVPFTAVTQSVNDPYQGFGMACHRTGGWCAGFYPEAAGTVGADFAALVASAPGLGEAEAFLDTKVADLGPGVWLAIGSGVVPKEIQCGNDSYDESGPPEDAYEDMQDGKLSMSPACGARGNLALSVDVGEGGTTLFLSFGSTFGEAMASFASVHYSAPSPLRDEAEAYWSEWISKARMPDIGNQDLLDYCRRTLLSIGVGTDRESGTIVASVSSQPPYSLDWPRDGAFLNYALDLAGFQEAVTTHNIWYATHMRKTEGQDAVDPQAPAGSFAMAYFADGTPGGPIDFEIDHVGLVLWSFEDHARRLDAQTREMFVNAVWPATQLAADLLATCKDESNGLQCLANEDDNPVKTQTLHGAETAWLGLRSAVRIAKMAGRPDDAWAQWDARADELRAAVDAHILLPDKNVTSPAWALWPARLVEPGHPSFDGLVSTLVAGIKQAIIAADPAGTAYQGKIALALSYALPDGHPDRAMLAQAVLKLATEIPTPLTRHLGEVYIPQGDLDKDGATDWSNRVAVPHLWEAALGYIAVMAMEDPSVLDMGPGWFDAGPADAAGDASVDADQAAKESSGGGGCSMSLR